MIGPVSSTGRTMMQSLQQQVQKGMPIDQAIAHVKSMAMDGIAPLTDLYSMLNQFQRLKQQQVKPPQNPPTVRDQIEMMARQGINPQNLQAQPPMAGMPGAMPQQANAPQMQPGAPPPQPMAQGLGAIDAGRMEYPQFAGGGIVAFSNGGETEDDDPGFFSRIAAGFASTGNFPSAAQPFLKGPERRMGPLAQQLTEVPDEILARRLADAVLQDDSQTINDLTVVLRQRNRTDLAKDAVALGKQKKESTAASSRAAQLGFGTATSPTEGAPPPRREIKKPDTSIVPPPRRREPTKTLEDFDKEQREFLSKRGVLTAEGKSVATQAYRDILQNEDKRLKEYFGKEKANSLAEAGFRMAAAASRPGATFLGALAEGGISHTQAMRAMNKEMEATRRALEQQKYMLAKADEADAREDFKAAANLRANAEKQEFELTKHLDNLAVDYAQIAATRENTAEQREMRQAMFGASQRSDIIERVARIREGDREYLTTKAKLDKAKEKDRPALLQKMEEINQRIFAQATGADLPNLSNVGDDEFEEMLRERGLSSTPLTPR